MRYNIFAGILLLFITTLTSCVNDPQPTYKDIEQRSLKAWIEKYRSDLVDNYQEDGGYYVEVLDSGIADSLPISGKDVWVWYDFTARDLQGNVIETRSASLAEQLATYTNYTHYIPAIRFSGKESHTLMEGTYLATFNKLNIRDKESGEMIEFEVRYGTRLKLYLPSAVIGSSTNTSDGGYEGQFTSDTSKPMVVDMTVYGHVNNPVAYEGERVDGFAESNGGLCPDHVAKDDNQAENSSRRRYATRSEEEDEEIDTRPLEFFDGRWHQPIDTLKHLYVNYSYTPESVNFDFSGSIGTDTIKYPSENIYNAGNIYGNNQMSDIDRRINEALVKRFGKGITYDEVLDADSLKVQGTARIWYIGRFVDGFIFDTNIDEVKEIIYGKAESAGEAIRFETTKPLENKYILAWNYSIPTLRYGQWAAILTVSTYGYGIAGQVGSHTTTTTGNNAYYDYSNYYNYMNYMNNYYGYGYGNMYNQGYYGYNPYYYGYNYPMVDSGSETTTTTTTSTEIPAYSPLIFQVFIEK